MGNPPVKGLKPKCRMGHNKEAPFRDFRKEVSSCFQNISAYAKTKIREQVRRPAPARAKVLL